MLYACVLVRRSRKALDSHVLFTAFFRVACRIAAHLRHLDRAWSAVVTGRVSFVDDAVPDQALPPGLADLAREAVQPHGDCAICGTALGPVPVRFGVHPMPGATHVDVRHATCGPSDPESSIHVMRSTAYRLAPMRVPLTIDGEPRTVSALLVNPSVDGWVIADTAASLLDGFRYRGFASIDQAVPSVSADEVPFRVDEADTIVLDDRMGSGYQLIDPPSSLVERIASQGGLLLVVSHAVAVDRIGDDGPARLGDLLSNPDSVVQAWVPAPPTGGDDDEVVAGSDQARVGKTVSSGNPSTGKETLLGRTNWTAVVACLMLIGAVAAAAVVDFGAWWVGDVPPERGAAVEAVLTAGKVTVIVLVSYAAAAAVVTVAWDRWRHGHFNANLFRSQASSVLFTLLIGWIVWAVCTAATSFGGL